MQLRYPYQTEADGNSLVVSFPDVPGALTQVASGVNFEATVRDCFGGCARRLRRAPLASAGCFAAQELTDNYAGRHDLYQVGARHGHVRAGREQGRAGAVPWRQ